MLRRARPNMRLALLALLSGGARLPLVAPGALRRLTLTRPQVSISSTAIGPDGVTAAEFGADVPRFQGTARRLLIEGQRTNLVRNPRGEGAIPGTPGTPPTNWTITASNNGISSQVVGFGVEDGLPGAYVRLTGTATANANLGVNFETTAQMAAAVGQTWTLSAGIKLTAGSMAGAGTINIEIIEQGGATNPATAVTNTPSSAMRRDAVTHTTSDAGTTGLTVRQNLRVNSGATFDATFFLAAPSACQAGFSCTPILPRSGANRITWSEALENAFWTKTAATIPETTRTAPNGSATGRLVNETGGTAIVQTATGNLVAVTSGAPHTLTLRLKRGNHDWVRIFVANDNAAASRVTAWVNLATGALGTVSTTGTWTHSGGSTVTALGNGWHLLELRFVPNNATLTVCMSSAAADNSTTRADVGGGAGVGCQFEAWGVQVEQRQPATAYQSNAGSLGGPAASTRGTDVVSATLPALGLPLTGAGTYLISAVFSAVNTAANQTLLRIDDTTENNRIFLLNQSAQATLRLFNIVGGIAAGADVVTGTITAGTLFRVALVIDGAGRAAVSFNGGAVVAIAGGATAFTRLLFGAGIGAASPMFAEVAHFSTLPTVTADGALPALCLTIPG